MSWNDDLKSPHLEIASSVARRMGVLAGPGTGKTTYGLIRRVARLLSERVNGKRILLLTFARTAALDLKNKIADVEVEGSGEVRASTLHAYCFGMLQREAILAITQRRPRILLPHEADLMLRDLAGDFGDINDRRARLEAFQAGWARGAEDHPGLAELPEDKAFEREVLSWLRHHEAMLIGEVVPIAFHYLRSNPAADELRAFDHVIVDEYQDLNHLEQHLLDLLAAEGNLCVAGDDDQSIYGFRFAHPVGIVDYRNRDEVEGHEIVVCGRCPRVILSMANSLISHAPDRAKPELSCLQEVDGDVAIVQWDDLDAEIEGAVAAIAADIQRERRAPGDILVLTHRRYIGEKIRKALIEQGVPAHSYFKEEGLGNDAAQEAFALLRLVVGDDRPALRVLLGIGAADGRCSAYKRLMKCARENNSSERQILDRLVAGEALGIVVPALLQRYRHVVGRLSQVSADDLTALIDVLFPDGHEDLADLRELALEASAEATSPKELLDAMVTTLTQVDIPQSPTFVRVMSLHKSKGLTSPAVFIVGVVDGIVPTIPSRLSEEAQELARAEQRRLFYVALTRAAEQLVISSATSMEIASAKGMGVHVDAQTVRRVGGKLVARTIASPYMSELGESAPSAVRGTDWIASY